MNGIINLLKPPGMTSHDAVAALRRLLGIRRIGHTGTLDPGAAGVLPICVGRATRLVQYIQATQKTYRAEITLGVETDTLDAAGKTVRVNTSFSIPAARLGDALYRHIGEILQVPPMVSGIRIQGRRLYELARRGEEVERPARPVHVYRIRVIRVWPEDALHLEFGARVLIDVECSKGTYIRSLAADIGRDLGCGAHLSFLVRTASGPFRLADTRTFEEIQAAWERGEPEAFLLPMEAGLAYMPRYDLDAEEVRRIRHGQALPAAGGEPGETVRLHAPGGELIALARVQERRGARVWQPTCLLSPAEGGGP